MLRMIPVKFVAKSRKLIPSELEGFAIANAHKYGIETKHGFCEVPEVCIDDLTEDYEKTL